MPLSVSQAMVRLVVPLLIFASPDALARRVRVVEGTSVYVVPRTMSLEEAEAMAMQRAITDALAAEFGTIVQTEVWTELYNDNEQSSAEAWMNGLNMVKGEWLETIGKPEINLDVSAEGYVVSVKIKGHAAAIESGSVDLMVSVKQTDGRVEQDASNFKSGNRLIIEFASPIDGHLAIFLADAHNDVVQLLPFAAEAVPATFVSGGRRYTFFADNSGEVEEQYSLYTDEEKERNILYIIFSPTTFTRPYADASGGVRTIESSTFRKWLSKQRASDSKMQAIIKPLKIHR